MCRCEDCQAETDRRFWKIVEGFEELPSRARQGHRHGPTVRCRRCGSYVALMHLGHHEAHACQV